VIGNELPQERNLGLADGATTVATLDWHSSSVTEELFERKSSAYFFKTFLTHSSPYRRRLCVRIPGASSNCA
jgi:hypothetical protein